MKALLSSTKVPSRLKTLIKGDDFARFMSKIKKDDATGCWLWTRHILPIGYAQFYFGGKQDLAHRFSFIHFKGPIPDGKEIDHKCRVRHCVNPDHLHAVTHRENQILGGIARRNGGKLIEVNAPPLPLQSELSLTLA